MRVNEELAKHVGGRLSDFVQGLLQSFGPDLRLGGGFIRDTLRGETCDLVELYPRNQKAAAAVVEALENSTSYAATRDEGKDVYAFPVYDAGGEETLELFVCRQEKVFVPSKNLVNYFDLSVNQAVLFWQNGWRLEATKEFLRDVQQGYLTVLAPNERTLFRAVALLNAGGYQLAVGDLAKALLPVLVADRERQFELFELPGFLSGDEEW